MNDALGTTQASASQLTFRQATLNDLPELSRVFNEIWPQEEPLKHTPMGLEMAKYLTLGYMSRATFANMAFTADGTFAGTTFARVEGQRLLFPEASDMARETAQFISEDPMGKLASISTTARSTRANSRWNETARSRGTRRPNCCSTW
ncbi:hypothetical protein [Bifidobacterium canis]|uniref:N-acetylglutamate synthase n=1 Tax=Bifidobacterium canis TaxID=2610880 RepID=A0A7K1J5B6_9BIFI|nr:hypothetical protein [Bifidobacterium canis]MUH59827.1 N-acetylglutamate synthase [Bifidobacterium canis]